VPQGLRVRVSSCPPEFMKVTIDSKKGLKTNLKVFIEKKIIDSHMKEKYDELSKTVVLKGFRPGKVPVQLLKKQFGNTIYNEVLDKILKETSANAIKEKKIKISGQPKIDLKKYGEDKIQSESIKLNFKGSAGQSFGAFAIKGLKLILKGDANDYVAKGLSGASVIVKLPEESNLVSNENTIIGNTVLYGATSGTLLAAGQAGERFAVRNSGATAVVEGCDSNGCEYMTGGSIVILGDVGDNFGAGMTGGMAFVYDPNNEFPKKANPETIIWQTPETEFWKNNLKKLVSKHYQETESNVSKNILENFDLEVNNFLQVCPKEMIDKLENPITNKSIVGKAS